jgi:hypothetical protein
MFSDAKKMCHLMEEMAEEQCRNKFLQRAAQCSVASSKSKLGYFETRADPTIKQQIKVILAILSFFIFLFV